VKLAGLREPEKRLNRRGSIKKNKRININKRLRSNWEKSGVGAVDFKQKKRGKTRQKRNLPRQNRFLTRLKNPKGDNSDRGTERNGGPRRAGSNIRANSK